jgi:hypothetical protein
MDSTPPPHCAHHLLADSLIAGTSWRCAQQWLQRQVLATWLPGTPQVRLHLQSVCFLPAVGSLPACKQLQLLLFDKELTSY